MHKTNGLNTESKYTRRKVVVIGKVKSRPVSKTPAAAQTAVQSPASSAEVKVPLCDAAVRTINGNKWALADAIVVECSETGDDGVRNGSHALMKAMRLEIAANHGEELSLVRIRKLRTAASAFPADRRRPAVSLECHLEAGTPDALDALIASIPTGTRLTRAYIREQMHLEEKAQRDQNNAERHRQREDEGAALRQVCKQLERERDEYAQKYADERRSAGKEPEPVSPPLVPDNETSLIPTEDLERAVAKVLIARGFDPKADYIRKALGEFVKAVMSPVP